MLAVWCFATFAGRVSSRKHEQQWEVELSVTIPLKKPDHHGAWEMSGNMEEAPGFQLDLIPWTSSNDHSETGSKAPHYITYMTYHIYEI